MGSESKAVTVEMTMVGRRKCRVPASLGAYVENQ
jgi:hypothetical protein